MLQIIGNYHQTLQAVENSITPLFLTLESAMERMIQFTDGGEAEEFISSVLNVNYQ
jgi:hypothetical protein